MNFAVYVNINCWFNVKILTAKLACNIYGVLKVRLSQVTGKIYPMYKMGGVSQCKRASLSSPIHMRLEL